MKIKTTLLAAGALLLAMAAPMSAAPTIEEEISAVASKVGAKLGAGKSTAADFADEIKDLDKLFEAHRRDGTDAAPQVLLAKANLFLQTLEDTDSANAALRQLLKEFPRSPVVEPANELLAMIDQHVQSMRIQDALKPGTLFPDFKEQDLDGQPLSLSRFRGKVVLIDFWATWCGPCMDELPNVVAAYKKYHAKGLEIIGISLDESDGVLKGFTAAKGMDWPQYFDGQRWDTKLVKRYGVTAIPATYLVGRDGKIIAKNLRGSELTAELEKQLGK